MITQHSAWAWLEFWVKTKYRERAHYRKIDKKLNINCELDIILSNLNVLILIIDNYVINAVMWLVFRKYKSSILKGIRCLQIIFKQFRNNHKHTHIYVYVYIHTHTEKDRMIHETECKQLVTWG